MHDRQNPARRWLVDVIGPGPMEVTPASGDASFRRYFRIRRGERSWILMDAPPDREDCRPFAQVGGLLEAAGVNVPRVEHMDLERGFMLLGDLGSTCYLDVLDETNADSLYGDAMETLLAIQEGVPAHSVPPYDRTLLESEMRLFPDWFLDRHLGMPADAARRRVLDRCFDLLCESALEQPRVFVHRDYHSRNLMLTPTRNPGVLDFQDAVCGAISYDLVSLLRDVYVRWPEARVDGWVASYHERATRRGLLEVPLSSFRRWFDLMGVQRHLKVAGIFARLYHRDGKPAYLRDIPLTLDYLRTACTRYPELGPLLTLLDDPDLDRSLGERNARVFGTAGA